MQNIPVSRPDISNEDLTAVQSAMVSLELSGHSPTVGIFEKNFADYLNVKDVVAVSNGSVAIDLSIEALDIKKSDICIVPTFTIISTVAELARRGAKIKLVDADPLTWSMDIHKTLEMIDHRVKLVLPVHIYGLPVDMDPLLEVQKNLDFSILEDAAEAVGVRYKQRLCGAIGNLGTFSFYANKLITCGEGGAIATNDLDLSEKLRSLRNLKFSKIERFVHDGFGYNARLSGLAASLVNSQLQRIEVLSKKKRDLVDLYLNGLKNHPWITSHISEVPYAFNSYWVFGIQIADKGPFNAKGLQKVLKDRGIETRRFFCPLHLQPFIKDFDFIFDRGNLKISESLWERGLYLPLGSGIKHEEVDRVIECLWDLTKPQV